MAGVGLVDRSGMTEGVGVPAVGYTYTWGERGRDASTADYKRLLHKASIRACYDLPGWL
jgi:hypothetical protein